MHESRSEPGLDNAENPFATVPIDVVVSVGRARPLIRDLQTLGENAVLPLDRRVEDPVELYVGEQLVARGQLEEGDERDPGRLSVRLTEILDQSAGHR